MERTAERRTGPGRGRDRGRAAGRGRAGGRRADEARNAAFDLLRAVDERDAYANLLLPALLRERGVTGRDAALATELAYGTLRGLGTYDADHRRVQRPGPGAARPAAARRPPARRAPAAAAPASRRTPRWHHRRPGAAARRGGPVQVRQRRAAQGRDPRPWRSGCRSSPRDPRRTRRPPRRHPQPPALDRHRAARRARRRPGRDRPRCSPPTTSGPLVTLVARPGRATVEELSRPGAEPRPLLAVRGLPARGRPGGDPRGRRGRAPPSRTRPASSSRSRSPGCRSTGADAPLARPVRRPRRQGGAARRRARRPGAAAPPARLPTCSTTGPAWSGRPTRDAAVVAADGTAPAWRPGRVRPGHARRPVHRPGRAAPPPGGPLAARPRRRCRSSAALQRAAARRGRSTRSGPAASSPTSPARRTWPRPRRGRATSLRRRGDVEPLDARAYLPEVRRARRRAVRAVLAAPARHRRDVPRPAAAHRPLTAGRPGGKVRRPGRGPATRANRLAHHGRTDLAQHPVRGLRAARRRGGPGRRRRRLAPRRRHGQPLRAQPHPRPAGRRVAAQGHTAAARLPPDDRGPGPVGARRTPRRARAA